MAPPLPTTTLPTTIGAPQPWPPPPTSSNSNTKTFKDCTQAICSITCPQWCNYLILPPPPPFDDGSDDSSSSSRISPLMAALIAVLAAAFLLLFYYTVISRLCRRRRNLRHHLNNHHDPILDPEARLDPMVQDPTRPGTGTGLDESFIRQITVFKYRRSDGLVEGTECAVCLNEFKEEESLRLMPNCEHAFHIPCIDTWLKSQSNCPLCRASMNPAPPARPVNPGPVTGPVTSVAAMRVERGGDAVLVVRELESDQVINVCHGRSGEEREGGNGEERAEEERGNGNGEEARKGDWSFHLPGM